MDLGMLRGRGWSQKSLGVGGGRGFKGDDVEGAEIQRSTVHKPCLARAAVTSSARVDN